MTDTIYYNVEVYKLLSNIIEVYNSIPDVTEITALFNKLSSTYPEMNKDNKLKIVTPALIFEEITNEPEGWAEGEVTARKVEYELNIFQKQPTTRDKNYIKIQDLTNIVVKTMEYSGFKTLSIFPDFDNDSNMKQSQLTFLLADKEQLKEIVKNL